MIFHIAVKECERCPLPRIELYSQVTQSIYQKTILYALMINLIPKMIFKGTFQEHEWERVPLLRIDLYCEVLTVNMSHLWSSWQLFVWCPWKFGMLRDCFDTNIVNIFRGDMLSVCTAVLGLVDNHRHKWSRAGIGALK